MAGPIGHVLSAQLSKTVFSEVTHPLLKSPGRGRKAKIDFATFEDTRISFALESKWFSRIDPNLDDILWDLVRLQLLANTFNTRCAFLFAGKKTYISPFLEGADFKYTRKGSSRRILPITPGGGTSRLYLKSLPPATQDRLSERLNYYGAGPLMDIIITTAPHIYPASHKNMTFPVYVWELIQSKK